MKRRLLLFVLLALAPWGHCEKASPAPCETTPELCGHIQICSNDLANGTADVHNLTLAKQIEPEWLNVVNGKEEMNVTLLKHFVVKRNFSCPESAFRLDPEFEELDQFVILSNGTLRFEHPNTSVFGYPPANYCIFASLAESGIQINALSCDGEGPPENDFKFWLYPPFFITSAIFALLTVIAYFLNPEQKMGLHDWSVVCQAGSLFFVFIGLSVNYWTGQYSNYMTCVTTTYITYYFLLVSFFWLNVMCIDIFLTFRTVGRRAEIKMMIPFVYAWGVPVLFTALVIALDQMADIDFSVPKRENISPWLPGIAVHRCWFHGFPSEALYFDGPVFLLLMLNIFLFGSTTVRLWKLKKEAQRAFRTSSSRVHNSSSHSQKDKDRMALYVKLFLLMGVTWIMEIVSWFIGGPDSIWYISDAVNFLRGVLMFWFCVWSNKSMRTVFMEKMCFWRRSPPETVEMKDSQRSGSTVSTNTNSTGGFA